MSRLLRDEENDPPDKVVKRRHLLVDDVPYGNSAARFWVGLIDEIAEDFPACSLVVMSAPVATPLSRRLLYPQHELQMHVEELMGTDVRDAMRRTLAELELTGPPSPVTVRLFAGDSEILSREFPAECLDSETFSYFVVWPLEWAHLPEEQWGNEFLSGVFHGTDPSHHLLYRVDFSLQNRHLSEGLYERTVSFSTDISAWA